MIGADRPQTGNIAVVQLPDTRHRRPVVAAGVDEACHVVSHSVEDHVFLAGPVRAELSKDGREEVLSCLPHMPELIASSTIHRSESR